MPRGWAPLTPISPCEPISSKFVGQQVAGDKDMHAWQVRQVTAKGRHLRNRRASSPLLISLAYCGPWEGSDSTARAPGAKRSLGRTLLNLPPSACGNANSLHQPEAAACSVSLLQLLCCGGILCPQQQVKSATEFCLLDIGQNQQRVSGDTFHKATPMTASSSMFCCRDTTVLGGA